MPRPTLNFVSGIATPPINQLPQAVAARTDLGLRIWYAEETDLKLYPWQTNPTHEVKRAEIYGTRWPSPQLVKLALRGSRDQGFMLAGSSNATMRALIPALATRGGRFAFFTDRPADRERSRSLAILCDMCLQPGCRFLVKLLQHHAGACRFGVGGALALTH